MYIIQKSTSLSNAQCPMPALQEDWRLEEETRWCDLLLSGESRDDLRLNNLLPLGMNSSFAFKLSAHEGRTCVSFIWFFPAPKSRHCRCANKYLLSKRQTVGMERWWDSPLEPKLPAQEGHA